MKLRLRGNSLRLRLRQSEVATLGRGAVVEEATLLGPQPGGRFLCRIEPGPGSLLTTTFSDGLLSVLLPAGQAADWAAGDSVGIYSETEWGLRIAIEKDFRCMEPRPDEDEAGAFERPADHGTDLCSTDDR